MQQHANRAGAMCRVFVRAALLVVLAASASWAGPAAAQDGDRVAELRARVAAARSDAERAYLTLADDHALVRSSRFARRLREPAVVTSLGRLFADAQGTPTEEREALLPELVRKLAADAPLSVPSTVCVVRAALAIPSGSGATAAERFRAAAMALFRGDTADVWDASFQDLPAVVAWRRANEELAAALSAAAVEPGPEPGPEPGAAPADGSGGEDTPATAGVPEPSSSVPERIDEPVFIDRGRAYVGPWEGWIGELDDRDNKRVRHSFKAFYVDRYEVTCAEYRAFLDGLDADDVPGMLPADWTLGVDGRPKHPDGRDHFPVTGVTFRQAGAYAESLGKRLPTEDEWERVAGGDGDARAYPWGDSPDGCSWLHGGGDATLGRVDAFPDDATPDGVIGLAGSVAELVAGLPDRKPIGRSGPSAGAKIVVRGGSYRSRASECVVTFRWVVDADEGAAHIGFRCVMDEAEYKRRQGR